MEALPDVLIDRGSDPAEAVARSERLHALALGVLVLPAEQRAALVLRELEGLSYEQIAQALPRPTDIAQNFASPTRSNVMNEMLPRSAGPPQGGP